MGVSIQALIRQKCPNGFVVLPKKKKKKKKEKRKRKREKKRKINDFQKEQVG